MLRAPSSPNNPQEQPREGFVPEAGSPSPGTDEMLTPSQSCRVYQKTTALQTPSAVNSKSSVLLPLSSGGQRMSKCHASTGADSARYMPSARGTPVVVQGHFPNKDVKRQSPSGADNTQRFRAPGPSVLYQIEKISSIYF